MIELLIIFYITDINYEHRQCHIKEFVGSVLRLTSTFIISEFIILIVSIF